MTLTDFPRTTPADAPSNSGAAITAHRPSTTPFDLEQEHAMLIDSDARSTLLEPREPDSPRPPGESVDAPTSQRTPVARCADGHGTLSALFFSDNVIDIARAKAMCGLCPLQADCLSGALERQEPWGVWGGELLSGGRIIANKRPCGRPPKQPRPELVIDELGPVGVPVAVA